MAKKIFVLFVFCILGLSGLAHGGEGLLLKELPVQHSGRLKPFDTFAREALQLVYGRQSYKTAAGLKQGATEVVLTWMIVPQLWDDTKIVLVRHNGLREYLKLGKKELYYSPQELLGNDRLTLLMQELRNKQQTKDKLDPFFQAAQTLENQITMYQAIRIGRAVRVLPSKKDTTWVSVDLLDEKWRGQFDQITKGFAAYVGDMSAEGSREEINAAVSGFIKAARAEFPEVYPKSSLIRAELHYNKMSPFMWAWIMYLVGALLFVTAMISTKNIYPRLGWAFSLLGILLHAYGFGLRVFIVGRAPVSNMYETVIWVAFGAVVFGMILEAIYRHRIVILAGNLVAVLCLVLSDLAPTVLNESLEPLQPVLRDNFWLLTHVLIITLSYAAFFLAFLLGDLMLIYYQWDEKRFAKQISQGTLAIYRSIQIGVVLLAAGTILGGVWADYSWGRFWGWDPKETWALIALLGYLAILHARLTGMLRPFGMAVTAVLAFSLVIMAWYGVNFVLGAGLHTYGFGAGGVEYVSAFVAVHLLFATYVVASRYQRKKTSQ